jgi:hypothetical protein
MDPGINIRILRYPREAITSATVSRAGLRSSFTNAGATTNFVVEYETALGVSGAALAGTVLATCEADLARVKQWFSDLTPPGLPFTSSIVQGSFGAFHTTCQATQLHLAAFDETNGELVEMVNMAEVVEVFEAGQAVGWDCGASNGEGLSRVLATELHPTQLNGLTTAASWLDQAPRQNFVDTTDQTDQNAISTGCAVLFLNYLRYQLKFSWEQIVAAGGPTLAYTYTFLTGQKDGWQSFSNLLSQHFPVGIPSHVTTDNVFPL